MNKLYRSRFDRVMAGVCGGVASYFEIDSTVVRLLFVFLWLFSGIVPLTIAYFLAILIIPLERTSCRNPTPSGVGLGKIFYSCGKRL